MSLTFQTQAPSIVFWGVAAVISASIHAGLFSILLKQPEPAFELPAANYGATGAILFDLSDIIADTSDAGENSQAMAESAEQETITETQDYFEETQAEDAPFLQQIPYEVEDDSLKFAIANPDLDTESEKKATETASEVSEEPHQESQVGSEAQDVAQASVAGVNAEQISETSTAQDEGITAEEKLKQVTDWQRAIVVQISKSKKYPQEARRKKIAGEVLVKFEIDRFGHVLAKQIETSSGSDILDAAALAVFDETGKLPTPPAHLEGDSFTIIVPVNYSFK